MSYVNLGCDIAEGVANVQLRRPTRANALDRVLWEELRQVFRGLESETAVRVVVLSGAGEHFCSGLDLGMLAELDALARRDCRARASEAMRRYILDLQGIVQAVAALHVPVVAAIDGACIGAGLDLATACDIRLGTPAARFSVREIDLGIVADLGVIQRLPRLVGDGRARELIYTGKDFDGSEAYRLGLLNRLCADRDALMSEAQSLARVLAAKSPMALRGCKHSILYSQAHSEADSLQEIALWNSAMLPSEDFTEAVQAQRERRPPRYRD